MKLQKMLARTNKFAVSALVVFAAFLSAPAQCAVTEFAAGVSMPTPMGDASQTLNRPLGYQAQVWLDAPQWFPKTLDFHLQATYQPFTVKNLPTATVGFFGLFGGVQATGGPSFLGITPFLALDIGGVYDVLSFSGASGASSNSGGSFAVQAVPGIDFPIFSHLGGVIEMPVAVVFQKSTLAIWNGSFSLRWKL
jgi:hypothetical protein